MNAQARNADRILRLLGGDPMSLMALATATQLETGRLTNALAALRRDRRVAYEGGKWRSVK